MAEKLKRRDMTIWRNRITEALKEFSISELEEIEQQDRQYKALERLWENVKPDKDLFFKLVITNALMSYQLKMRGEDYWERFAKEFSDKPSLSYFPEFLSKYNNRFLNAKLKRLKKVLACTLHLNKNHYQDIQLLISFLCKCLNQKCTAKTINFAGKMHSYAYKIVYGDPPKNLSLLYIPIDARLSKISKDMTFWQSISRETNLPLIKLDGLFYLSLHPRPDLSGFKEGLRKKIERFRLVLQELNLDTRASK